MNRPHWQDKDRQPDHRKRTEAEPHHRREHQRHASRPFQDDLDERDALERRARDRDRGYDDDSTFAVRPYDSDDSHPGSEWVAPAGGYRRAGERANYSGPRLGSGYGVSSGYADAERYGSSRGHHEGGELHPDFAEQAYRLRDPRALKRTSMRDWARADFAEREDFRGVGPRNYKRTDARICDDLCDSLTDAPDVDASNIEVSVREGVAVLTGNVSMRAMKHRAEDLAEATPGVRDVDNQLRVQGRNAGLERDKLTDGSASRNDGKLEDASSPGKRAN